MMFEALDACLTELLHRGKSNGVTTEHIANIVKQLGGKKVVRGLYALKLEGDKLVHPLVHCVKFRVT